MGVESAAVAIKGGRVLPCSLDLPHYFALGNLGKMGFNAPSMKPRRAAGWKMFGIAAGWCAFALGLMAALGSGCGGPRHPSCGNDEPGTRDTHNRLCVNYPLPHCPTRARCKM